MASWIKIETTLPDKNEVMRLADILDIHYLQVVGHLVRFWSWCDANMSAECPVVTGTKRGLDRVADRDGFVAAMAEVGWLDVLDDGTISIPNFEYHLSKSAKTRANEQKRKYKSRSLSGKCPAESGTSSGTTAGPDKRREDESIKSLSLADEYLDVIIPEYMQSKVSDWLHVWKSRHGENKPMPSPTLQSLIHRLHSQGESKALADLEVMIQHMSKGYNDSQNDYQKLRTATNTNHQPRKKLTF